MDNPEKLATRRGNQQWTIQRNWQNSVHKKKTNKANTTTQYVFDTTMRKQIQLK